MDGVKTLTLSYTFFPTQHPEEEAEMLKVTQEAAQETTAAAVWLHVKKNWHTSEGNGEHRGWVLGGFGCGYAQGRAKAHTNTVSDLEMK